MLTVPGANHNQKPLWLTTGLLDCPSCYAAPIVGDASHHHSLSPGVASKLNFGCWLGTQSSARCLHLTEQRDKNRMSLVLSQVFAAEGTTHLRPS